MAIRKYEYPTPKGGWTVEIFRNCNGFIFGNIRRYGNHHIGWQIYGNNIHWDHKQAHPKYITAIVENLWRVFRGDRNVVNADLKRYLLYQVPYLVQ